MTTLRTRRIDRRRLVASSAIGGAAFLAGGALTRGATGTSQPATLALQGHSRGASMFRGNAARTGEMPGPGPSVSNEVEMLWQFSVPVDGLTGVAVVDGTVYAGSDDSVLYALNAADGTERWQFATEGIGMDSRWIAQPAVASGVVYVGTATGALHAVDAGDGSARWSIGTPTDWLSTPAVAGGVVYVAGRGGRLFAFDTEGGERWQFSSSDDWIGSPSVADGVVYAGSFGGTLHALDAAGGQERWRVNLTGLELYSPAVAGGAVYGSTYTPDYDVMLYCVDAIDGTERWRFTAPGESLGDPAVANGVVYAGSNGGQLHAIDAGDGTVRWSIGLGAMPLSTPSFVDGVLYVGGIEVLHAIDAMDGTELWRIELPGGSIRPCPAVVGGVVYATSHGTVYAVGSSAGKPDTGRAGAGQPGSARVTMFLTLRLTPSSTGMEGAWVMPGTLVTITGEAETTGGVEWWPVVVDETGDQGWVEASALEPLSSGPDSTPTA